MESPEFQEGEIAWRNGEPITANPYQWGSSGQNSWARGWKSANYIEREKARAEWKKLHPQPEGADDDIPF